MVTPPPPKVSLRFPSVSGAQCDDVRKHGRPRHSQEHLLDAFRLALHQGTEQLRLIPPSCQTDLPYTNSRP